MKRIILLVTMLVMLSSTCFAERTFDDGTVLNDKEELIYEVVEKHSSRFLEPSEIRFKGSYMTNVYEFRNIPNSLIEITLSLKNSSGGRVIMTFTWDNNGKLIGNGFAGYEYSGLMDKDVDYKKLNHVWKTYHADDD